MCMGEEEGCLCDGYAGLFDAEVVEELCAAIEGQFCLMNVWKA